MLPKKNPKKDLNLKTGLYFLIALLLLLAIVFIALEWKTIDDNKGYEVGNSLDVESSLIITKT